MSSYGVTDDFGSAVEDMVSGCPDDRDDDESRQDDDDRDTESRDENDN